VENLEPVIVLVGSFDTKDAEYHFLQEQIEAAGLRTLLIDTGVMSSSPDRVSISNHEVASAGGSTVPTLREANDRGIAQEVMSRGLEKLLPQLYADGRFDGVIGLGGTGGTSVVTAGMRKLPIGVPKVMVSTVAGGDVSGYVGVSDIIMVPSVVDVAGLNKFSRAVFTRAAAAISAMVRVKVPKVDDRPLIVASMFGNTTPAVEAAKAVLEQHGYEVLVFHSTGNGGRTMESLIESGEIVGVLDITTTEWADELVGGVFTAGPDRLSAAARHGVSAIVTPGCLDMVNFWGPHTVPSQFSGRKFYQHNPNVTLMRTNIAENQQLGRLIAEKLNVSIAPVTVLLPLGGLSMIDMPGKTFWWPEADQALFDSLRSHLREGILIIEMQNDVNAPEFAERCATELLNNIQKKKQQQERL
jgi:uncharacterized protein (UPF0261 family)